MYPTRKNSLPFMRPAWTPATIAMMVVGFMLFWPLGLAMIAYIVWGDRLEGLKRDTNKATDSFFSAFKGYGPDHNATVHTGNVAFDDWRKAELERLEQERSKLNTMRDEFDDHMRELRRARDEQEFQSFMRERKANTTSGNNNSNGSDISPQI